LPVAEPDICGREPQRLYAKTIRRLIMKTIVSALLALTVLTSVAVAPASAAWDTKKFLESHQNEGGGG
jgi:hypothetical protein